MADRTAMTELYDMSWDLKEGEQRGGKLCPFCEGGREKEKTFSIKRESGRIIYICHRASCNRAGSTVATGGAGKMIVQERETHITPYKRAIKTLGDVPDVIKKELADKYHFDGLDLARLGCKWSEVMDRLWMPIRTERGFEIGGTLRTFKASTKPKSYTFLNNFEYPNMSWYKNHTVNWDKVVIVEDQLSACRACNVVSSVSLQSTNLNLMGIRLLAAHNPSLVVLCLDGDAFSKALELQNKYSGMFDKGKLLVVKPPSDLKNMSKPDLSAFLRTTFGD